MKLKFEVELQLQLQTLTWTTNFNLKLQIGSTCVESIKFYDPNQDSISVQSSFRYRNFQQNFMNFWYIKYSWFYIKIWFKSYPRVCRCSSQVYFLKSLEFMVNLSRITKTLLSCLWCKDCTIVKTFWAYRMMGVVGINRTLPHMLYSGSTYLDRKKRQANLV